MSQNLRIGRPSEALAIPFRVPKTWVVSILRLTREISPNSHDVCRTLSACRDPRAAGEVGSRRECVTLAILCSQVVSLLSEPLGPGTSKVCDLAIFDHRPRCDPGHGLMWSLENMLYCVQVSKEKRMQVFLPAGQVGPQAHQEPSTAADVAVILLSSCLSLKSGLL